MTDRERLLKILNVPIYPHENVDPLEAVADYLLDNGVTFGAAVPGHENNYDIAEMAYNNGYAKGLEDSKPKWISVVERLPDKGGVYIVLTTSGAVTTGRFYEEMVFEPTHYRDKVYVRKADWSRNRHVTHWMSFPEPPKENDNGKI